MKKLLCQLAIGLAFFSAPRLFVFAAPSAVSPSIYQLVPPVEALVVDDLDVRDAFNRPVRSLSAKQTFERLWTRNLTQMFLMGLTPTRLQMLSLLRSSWESTKSFFTKVFKRVVQEILGISPTSFTLVRRVSKNTVIQPIRFSGTSRASPYGFANNFLALVLASTQILC